MRTVAYYFMLVLLVAGYNSCGKDDVSNKYEYRNLGSSARDLLSDSNYTSLDIEISFSPGFEPNDSVLNLFRAFLQTYLKKPGGINFYPKLISGAVPEILNISNMVALEKSQRTRFTRGQTLAVHFMIPASGSGGADVLGTSYWNTSTCIFGKTVEEYSGNPWQVNRTMLLVHLFQHEMGHLLGLVDQGSPMVKPHKDGANGSHCDNKSCLMNYLIETAIQGNGIPRMDANCLSDLKNNGGK
jgi:hypothetical protein